MNILITGAAGALGRNLTENLKAIRDGKNRTRPGLQIGEIYEYDRGNPPEDLDRFCAGADFIVHAAGVNRPKDPAEFMEGNFGFTSRLLEKLKEKGNRAPIVLTSSVQAALSGRFGDSAYGRSKLAGEELLFAYGRETGAPVYVYRFQNMAGKWITPRYNSAVATFCYCISRGEPITVNDPDTELELVFFDDLCEELYDCMEGHPHRCEYPEAGEVIEGVSYDGVTARYTEGGRYCGCPVSHRAKLGRIAELLKQFAAQPDTLVMPPVPEGSFEKKLFSMYLSYLPEEKTCVDLKGASDARGSFTEVWRSLDHGQFSVNVSRPGAVKGEHWHLSKWEIFIVVSGHGIIRERNLYDDEIREYEVSGEKLQAVYCLPGWTHSIENLSGTEPMVTLMWANEIFDPERPDTCREPVRKQ